MQKPPFLTASPVSAACTFQQHDFLFRKFLTDIIGSGKTCITAADDDHICFVVAPQGFIDAFMFKAGGFEPEVIYKIFI